MAKGVHVPGASGEGDDAYVSYTAKLTRELRAAARRGQKVSVEVVFSWLDDYNAPGREYNAPMNFFQTGYCHPLWLLEQLQSAGYRKYWRDAATERLGADPDEHATGVGGVKRVTLRYHDKWSSTFQRRKSDY